MNGAEQLKSEPVLSPRGTWKRMMMMIERFNTIPRWDQRLTCVFVVCGVLTEKQQQIINAGPIA